MNLYPIEINSDTTVSLDLDTYTIDASGNDVTLTLPDMTGIGEGAAIIFKRKDNNTSFTVTIAATGTTIDGGASITISINGFNVIVYDGSVWTTVEGGIGCQGSQGAQGFQGSTGAQGSQGSQGFQGSTGAQGSQGAQGFQGFQGSQGAGLPASVQGDIFYASAVNTVTTISKSTSASNFLKNSGTSNNPAWVQPATTDLSDVTTWTDYSGTSTITGWSSRTTSILRYSIVGKTLYVWYMFVGTSNSTAISFTLPNTAINVTGGFVDQPIGQSRDNSIYQTTLTGLAEVQVNTNTVNCYKDQSGTAWTNSGTKSVGGILILPIQ